jgi:hypothetical protein
MTYAIDTGSELLIDRSQVRIPQLQLLLAAIGEPLARGSAWVAVKKSAVALYGIRASHFTACSVAHPRPN